jgi:uncharacterized repeat protein (TIGR03803 family)
VQGSDGNFYGTTALGGANSKGTTFKIDATGTLTTLHSFSGFPTDGAIPTAGLVQDNLGFFHGTTASGGLFYQGTVFGMTSSGVTLVLHSFNSFLGEGAVPTAGLVQGTDGNFYGTTASGGAHFQGTVFQITPAGALTVLHSFSGYPTEGAVPSAALVRGNDGNFYGTTGSGGAHFKGTVFKIDATGNLTTLHSFSGSPSDGTGPVAGLVQGTDGNFYGTTAAGGAHYQGTAFEITPAGALTVLHSFSGSPSEGAGPVAGLVQGSDGNFYGTTTLGGANSKGTVFKLSSSSISNN